MKTWQAVVLTAFLGVFTVVFLVGLALIGLDHDPSGANIERPTEEATAEDDAESRALPEIFEVVHA